MSSAPKDPFETALAALLGPLAQAMVARGVTLGTAQEALKNALLQAALQHSGEDISDSRASLLTGLHRKDVKRLRNQDQGCPTRRSNNAAAIVISHWATDPDYQDTSGKPRDLPRKGSDDAPGFDDLIRKARVDMAPGTVLSALKDQDLIREMPDGRWCLLTHAFLPKAGNDEQVAAYQATLCPHLTAATQNLLAGDTTDRHFDRAVRYSHLSAESVDALQQAASDGAQALLQEINQQARSLQDQDTDKGETGRFAFGAYILPETPEEGDR